MTTRAKRRIDTGKLVRIALMGGISALLGFFPEIPMTFLAPWLKLDFAYIPMLLTGYALGFWPGMIVLTIKNIFQVISSNSFGVGQLADMLMGMAMLLPAVLVYQQNHTRKNAVIGMAIGTAAMVVVGVVLNRYLLLPVFLGDRFAAFMDENPLILWIGVAPFNLIKGASVSIVTYLLYRHLAPFLKQGLKA